MEYQALYRQFRPETFDDVVGQEHIVRALSNQIESGKLSHAYLFCGTRGTGKTTTARILSRAVNCECRTGANPCNRCDACKSMIDGSAIDVVEIDAASNTSVDNIRDIRDEVIYPPVVLKHKVYIIDEVHMLSMGAFNALLKTLEEPPEHVIFILATTEYHKVPATILSRCQRFDFHRIESKKIMDRIKFVCEQSGCSIDDEACSTITYAADGSMRDALAILDKCASFGSDNVTGELVTKILGIVDDSTMFDIVSCIADKDTGTLIEKVEYAIRDGRDPVLLTSYMIEHFRCLLVAMLSNNLQEVLQMSHERAIMFKEQAKLFTVNSLTDIVNKLCNTYKLQKESPNPKVMLEIGLVSLCNNQGTVNSVPATPKFVDIPSKEVYVKTEPVNVEVPKGQSTVNEPSVINDEVKSKPVGDGKISGQWQNILKQLMANHKMRLFAELTQADAYDEENCLVITLPASKASRKEYIGSVENIKSVQEAVEQLTGSSCNVKFEFGDVSTNSGIPQQAAPEVPISDADVPPETPTVNSFISDVNNILNLADKFPDIVSIDESEDN